PSLDIAQFYRDSDDAVAFARSLNWRAGEAYALLQRGLLLGSYGDYTGGLQSAHTGRDLAETINHRQWLSLSNWALGILHDDLLAFEQARAYLEQSILVAREVNSQIALILSACELAKVLIQQHEFDAADQLIRTGLDSAHDYFRSTGAKPSHVFLGQMFSAYVSVELALARHDPHEAQTVLERVLLVTPNWTPSYVLPYPWYLRAQALLQLGALDEAANYLHEAEAAARARDAKPLLWRIFKLRAAIYQQQGRVDDAQRDREAFHALVAQLAESIADTALRETFVRRALIDD
ncbi:MAG: hypothetical protein LC737_00010, partial [Chloroflexi bacterium]|nr:hypothetical protein [Chloroflexota bacterium]